MNIKPEELTGKDYVLLDQMGHHELVPFIRMYMSKKTAYRTWYYLCNFIIFGFAGYLMVAGYGKADFHLGDRVTHFCYGLAIALILVPLHEFIHVLAYRSQGASNTSYDANIKKFYFMALADKFVANRKEFTIVALAPFIVITVTLLILLFIVSNDWKLTIAGILLAHTSMCSGDFGLLSYFECHKNKQVVTYDDVANKITYFYGKETEKVA